MNNQFDNNALIEQFGHLLAQPSPKPDIVSQANYPKIDVLQQRADRILQSSDQIAMDSNNPQIIQLSQHSNNSKDKK